MIFSFVAAVVYVLLMIEYSDSVINIILLSISALFLLTRILLLKILEAPLLDPV